MFNRKVSANLGMSYSVSNVLAEAGEENIIRWLPIEMETSEVRNRIRNKMIRPTTIPSTLEELKLEQAIAREALRLALEHHKSMAVGLKGIQQERTISDAFAQARTGETLVNMMELNLVVGSGGALSHAPRRSQAAMMLLDAFQPEGVTRLAVDSIFMMPHLGVLTEVHPEAAQEVFEKDCLIHLGTSIAPAGQGKEGRVCVNVRIIKANGEELQARVNYGDIKCLPLEVGETARAIISPERGFDVGAGSGKVIEAKVEGGLCGIIIDARGRPLTLPVEEKARREALKKWALQINAYPI
ncbi:MAG: glutamate mutase L [candidate division WOR-3 bacterium]